MERTQTAECTDVLAEHLHADLGIRTNKAKQLATALVEHAHDTVEAFSRLAEPELRDIGFADGHIKRVKEYRAQRGVGSGLGVARRPCCNSVGLGRPQI